MTAVWPCSCGEELDAHDDVLAHGRLGHVIHGGPKLETKIREAVDAALPTVKTLLYNALVYGVSEGEFVLLGGSRLRFHLVFEPAKETP